jgi:hypothetical protein
MSVLTKKPIETSDVESESPNGKNKPDYEEMARKQGIKPIEDVEAWLASLPVIDDGGELYDIIMANRRADRELARSKGK